MKKLQAAAAIVGTTLITIASTCGVGHAAGLVTNIVQSYTPQPNDTIFNLCYTFILCKPGDVTVSHTDQPFALAKNDTGFNISSFIYTINPGQDAVWNGANSNIFSNIQTSADGKTQTLSGGNIPPGSYILFDKKTNTSTDIVFVSSFTGTAVPEPSSALEVSILGILGTGWLIKRKGIG